MLYLVAPAPYRERLPPTVECSGCVVRRHGQASAEARTIGDPATYSRPFWGDLDSRPFMRALHGQGLCLWRLGRAEKAREVFAWMLTLNPNDNQGVRFLLHDLDEGLSWEESVTREEQEQQDYYQKA